MEHDCALLKLLLSIDHYVEHKYNVVQFRMVVLIYNMTL